MSKFPKYDVAEMLGLTRISRVTDYSIYSLLVTPQVRSMLGDIKETIGPQVMETTQGFFPGDEVTNLNDHRLYGGQHTNKLRFPYINTLYRTQWGGLVIKRDALKIKALGWVGDLNKNPQLIYKAALRDRRYDGTLRANDCGLADYSYDGKCNLPLPVGRGVELSIYGFLPGSRIVEVTGDQEYENFIGNPFRFIATPEKFLQYFEKAWLAGRAPGQIAAPIPDVSRLVPPSFETVARKSGYDFLENAPSHYHVVMWALGLGYRFTYKRQAEQVLALKTAIDNLKASGTKLNRVQESWIVVLQSLRPLELIPKNLYLGGAQWPQTNLDEMNLWVNKPMHPGAEPMLPSPLEDCGCVSSL